MSDAVVRAVKRLARVGSLATRLPACAAVDLASGVVGVVEGRTFQYAAGTVRVVAVSDLSGMLRCFGSVHSPRSSDNLLAYEEMLEAGFTDGQLSLTEDEVGFVDFIGLFG